jgi:hypothetical protein
MIFLIRLSGVEDIANQLGRVRIAPRVGKLQAYPFVTAVAPCLGGGNGAPILCSTPYSAHRPQVNCNTKVGGEPFIVTRLRTDARVYGYRESGNASWCTFKVATRLVNPCMVRDGAPRSGPPLSTLERK